MGASFIRFGAKIVLLHVVDVCAFGQRVLRW